MESSNLENDSEMQKLNEDSKKLIASLLDCKTRAARGKILKNISERESKCSELRNKSMELVNRNHKVMQEYETYIKEVLEHLAKPGN